ncbi:MAG: calcium:proton antiporter [Hyphomicrobiaceae bacterium]
MRLPKYVRKEFPLIIGFVTVAAFHFFADGYLTNLKEPSIAVGLFCWLFVASMLAAFGVVRHAEILAEKLGEPFGTLVLTISVVGIEVSLISAVMLTGQDAPTLARDTMFAVLMIVLNGLVGLALLIGGARYSEQDYSLEGARSFLSVLLPLSVFALILPNMTVSTADETFAPEQSFYIALATVLLYGVFLGIQTMRHRSFFEEPGSALTPEESSGHSDENEEQHELWTIRSGLYHAILLVVTILPIVLLSKRIAKVVDFGIVEVGAPVALGGVFIAALVLAPESLAALTAAAQNKLQRSVNLLLGAALATIGLTLPAVLAISIATGETLKLGLDPASSLLLVLTLFVSMMTFGGARTNVLQGAVHLVLFLTYVMLIFSP